VGGAQTSVAKTELQKRREATGQRQKDTEWDSLGFTNRSTVERNAPTVWFLHDCLEETKAVGRRWDMGENLEKIVAGFVPG
jgi:hypothetical protein